MVFGAGFWRVVGEIGCAEGFSEEQEWIGWWAERARGMYRGVRGIGSCMGMTCGFVEVGTLRSSSSYLYTGVTVGTIE